MHIAICNDNVADRKQLERLLARESDKRLSTSGNLYVDSYGHPDSLLKNPMQFDAFFIDMELTPDISDSSVLQCLITAGCSAPVILLYASPEEKEEKKALGKDAPMEILLLEKPVRKEELSSLLDNLLVLSGNREVPIEIRAEAGTHYIYESDILYAEKKGGHIYVTLKSGEILPHNASLESLFAQLEAYPVFFAPNRKTILNGRYIKSVQLTHITMCDGHTFSAIGAGIGYAKKCLAEYAR